MIKKKFKNVKSLVVRWAPGSTPATGITHEYFDSGRWLTVSMDQIESMMGTGTVVHWSPTGV